MQDLKQNIKFNYLYRDAGNYKSFGSVVFSNKNCLTTEEINSKITSCLISGEFFIPSKWKIPLVYIFPYDSDLDHEWFEYYSCEYSEDEYTDRRTIEEFLKGISLG